MKKWVVAALLVFVVGLAAGLFLSGSRTGPAVASPERIASEDSAVAGALAKQNSNTVAIIESNFARVQPPASETLASATTVVSTAPSGAPSPLEFTNFAPAIVLENMTRAVRQFSQMFGGNPVGTNPEITSQLNGNNPKHINFLNAEAGMRVNAAGELVDPWGTPYFFHQLSGTDMEVHSAGPDRMMWTSDDLVTK